MTSYNVHDAEHRYCGNCHHYCDQVPHPRWTVRVSGQAHGKGILITESVDEAVSEVERYVRAGVQTITIHRWPASGWVPPSVRNP